jgi:hypothetical protein
MRDRLVINTGPLIALALACENWDCLRYVATEVIIPAAVMKELRAGPADPQGRRSRRPPACVWAIRSRSQKEEGGQDAGSLAGVVGQDTREVTP